mmetsp:Transcript_94769/g.167853  ORF Transcript_94769/g.167853 Transcript_94769/m.167853 type:complete len:217 (+) Transcript_94769:571-1221(+)
MDNAAFNCGNGLTSICAPTALQFSGHTVLCSFNNLRCIRLLVIVCSRPVSVLFACPRRLHNGILGTSFSAVVACCRLRCACSVRFACLSLIRLSSLRFPCPGLLHICSIRCTDRRLLHISGTSICVACPWLLNICSIRCAGIGLRHIGSIRFACPRLLHVCSIRFAGQGLLHIGGISFACHRLLHIAIICFPLLLLLRFIDMILLGLDSWLIIETF